MLFNIYWYFCSLTYHFLAVARIEKAPKSQIVQVGDSVEFKCKISGNLSPRASWYKDGNELKGEKDKLMIITVSLAIPSQEGNELEEKECILKITNAQIEHEGEYTCIVRNEFEEQKCTAATLTVEGREREIYLTRVKHFTVKTDKLVALIILT